MLMLFKRELLVAGVACIFGVALILAAVSRFVDDMRRILEQAP